MDKATIEGLVRDDRQRRQFKVDRRSFVDREVFELERDRIFDRCWLYTAHESEIANAGDFITRQVAGRPLLITRDESGDVHVLVNACSHRGNLVTRERRGQARAFSCFYHSWTFDSRGALLRTPGDDAYAPGFDKVELGLTPVPRMESYRGLIFACFDPGAVDLLTYFGDEARAQIDHVIDSAAADVEIVEGEQSYSMKANWKLLVENSIDAYHGVPTHHRYFRTYLNDIGVQSNVAILSSQESSGRGLGHGHAVTEKPKHSTALMAGAAAELAAQRAVIDANLGKTQAHLAADFDRNVFIFPNLVLISTWRTIRTFYPVAPDYMEINAWALMPKNESQELRQKRFENFISFLGPAGFGTPDDVSALEGCQRGFAASKEARWSDISRGMARDRPLASDELQMRAFWRRWHALLKGETGPTDCSDEPTSQPLQMSSVEEA